MFVLPGAAQLEGSERHCQGESFWPHRYGELSPYPSPHLFSSWMTTHEPSAEDSPFVVPPVLHSRKQRPQFEGHHEFKGSSGSIIIAFPAAVNFDFVQKSGGFGSEPQPQAPLVMSLYQVVEAQGRPLYIGGQPSHFDNVV